MHPPTNNHASSFTQAQLLWMGSEFDAVTEHVPDWNRHLLLAREMHDTQAHPAFTTACCCSQLGRALLRSKKIDKREGERGSVAVEEGNDPSPGPGPLIKAK